MSRIHMKILTRRFLIVITFVSSAYLDHSQELNQSLPNIDRRLDVAAWTPEAQRLAALRALKARLDECQVHMDPLLGTPRAIYRLSRRGFLTEPDPAASLTPLRLPPLPGGPPPPAPVERDFYRPVRTFLAENAALFGHGAEMLAAAKLKREYVTAHNGMRTVVWEQQLDGLPVFGGVLIGHINRAGALVSLSSQALPDLASASGLAPNARSDIIARPPISAQQAVRIAATSAGVQAIGDNLVLVGSSGEGSERRQLFQSDSLAEPASVRLIWLPMHRQALRLCWDVILVRRDGGFRVLLDATAGTVIVRQNLTSHATSTSYRVFTSDSPSPYSPGYAEPSSTQPPLVNRTFTQSAVALSTIASPNGWIDEDDRTYGNNVDAHTDLNSDFPNPLYKRALPPPNPPRPIASGSGTDPRVFDFPLDLTVDPSTYRDAAVVNAFYWCNWMHDRLYDLGFTEAAGNFQNDNFGRGGAGGDPVLVDVQDVAASNNASFTTFPDGTPGRMQLHLFTGPSPHRDSAFDTEIILHEFTHGLVSRLVAGGEPLMLFGLPRALNEGWCDFFALSLLSQASDPVDGNYAWGGYSSYARAQPTQPPQPFYENYYFGLRRYPYSTDMTKNPHTLRDIDYFEIQQNTTAPFSSLYMYYPQLALEPYWCAEVWAVTLWDVRANLISKYGFQNGNDLVLRLVMDGMKLCPPAPNLLDGRDALLLADRVYTGGQNRDAIWAAFAKRGMGVNAAINQEHPYNPDLPWDAVVDFTAPPLEESGWTFNAQGSFQGSSSAPSVGSDGTIYVGSAGGYVFAVNPNGTQRWRFPNGAPLSAFYSTPTVGSSGDVYIGCANGRLYCLRADGTEKWSYLVSGEIRCSPVEGIDGTIYFSTINGQFYALTSSGTLRSGWNSVSYPGQNTTSPAFGPDSSLQGIVYFGHAGGVVALSSSASVRWTRPLPGGIRAGPALGDDGKIYVGCSDQKLYAINGADGTVTWSTPALAGQVLVSPVIGQEQIVYVATDQGIVYAYTNANGGQRWLHSMGTAIRGAPFLGRLDEVYVGTDSGIHMLVTKFVNGNASAQLIPVKTFAAGEVITSPGLLLSDGALLQVTQQKLNAWHNVGLPGEIEWPMFQRDASRTGNNARVTLNLWLVRFEDDTGFWSVAMMVRNLWPDPIGAVLEATSSLAPPTWTSVPESSIGSMGRTSIELRYQTLPVQQYYRLRLVPGP